MFLKSSGFGCGGGGFLGAATFASSFLGSGFFASSFFSASASGFASGFFSASCGFASGLASAFGAGLGSGGLEVGSGSGICAEAVMISCFSLTLGAGLSTGLGSATFSTSGLGAGALGAVLVP